MRLLHQEPQSTVYLTSWWRLREGLATDKQVSDILEIREGAGYLAHEMGMNVVFIGHADVETLTLPDMDPYNR